MKFAVCITPVMDMSSPVDFAALMSGRSSTEGIQFPGQTRILNPADEAAAWFAATLKRPGEAVLAIHVGGPDGESALRDALAIVAGEALRLELPGGRPPDAPLVAEALGDFFAAEPVDWVFCGQATLDWGSGLVGATVAEFLDRPFVDHVLDVVRQEDGSLRCVRLVSRGEREEVSVAVPAVISFSPLAYRTRLVPVPQKLRARRLTIPTKTVTLRGRLPHPTRQEAKRPLPRPKDSLPPDFSSLSAADRLTSMLQTMRPTASITRAWLEGGPEAVASQILDFIEAAGHDWKGSRSRHGGACGPVPSPETEYTE